jgi:alpha-beta hydrolase superfamily lysophospholipase
VTLRYARWAARGAPQGTVCVFTGRSEAIEKYFETIADLLARGFAVAAMDWRGQGTPSACSPIRLRAMSNAMPTMASTSKR